MNGPVLDLAFLDAQTFGDAELAREVLELFAEQAARLVPVLPALPADAQGEMAHLLKGSCQGIGAVRAADLLQRYGLSDAAGRRALEPELEAVFTDVQAAIAARLAAG